MSSEKGFFASLSPRASFLAGIIAMFVVFFVVGFFVLLSLYLKGETKPKTVGTFDGTTEQQAAPTVGGPETTPVVSDADWTRGNKNARISIIEYSDFECPYCSVAHPTFKQLVDAYPEDVSWTYRHFPLSSIHLTAQRRSEAAECVGNLAGNDAFWEYTDALFVQQETIGGVEVDTQLADLAEEIGVERESFASCLANNTYTQLVQDQYNDAIEAGGQGTPYSIIMVDDQVIPVSGAVPYEQFDLFVQSVLTGENAE